MALRPIRIYPDPVLREVCPPVERFDDELRRLSADMIETMRAAPGVGLAASQVGVPLRLCVLDPSAGSDPAAVRVLVNPELLESEGVENEEEGCLSIPGFVERVERPERVTVRGFDLDGGEISLCADGILARVVCHEIDHLNGVLFVDRLRGLRRERARRALRRMAEEATAAP
jgi:peptide deformylase